MNKILLLLLILAAPQLYAENLETSSEVVDPMVEELSTEEIVIPTEETAKVEEKSLEAEKVAENPPEKIIEEKVAQTIEEEPLEAPAAEVKPTPAPEAVVAPAPVVVKPAPAPNTSTAKVEEDEDFNPRKGHWIATFGFEGLEYTVPLDFQGTKEHFEEQKRSFYGGRLGFGREFYLGWGFNTTTKIEGFYTGTLFEKATNAGSETDAQDYAYVKQTGQIYGGDITQSLGLIFDFHTRNPFMDEMAYMTLEPFVFAGIGRARAYNRLRYHYDTTVEEDYMARVQDSITSSSVGGGINLTSRTGFFLYLKATQYRMNITKRTEEGYSQPDGGARVDLNRTTTDVSTDPITIYALGGGYKF